MVPAAPSLRRPVPPPGWRVPWSRLRRRPFLWWVTALGLLVGTIGLVGGSLDEVAPGAADLGAATPVLVATHTIAVGEVVGEANTEVRSLPRAAVAPGGVGPAAIGSRATQPIHRGEVVHEQRLAPGGLSTLAAILPSGTRGIAVQAGAGALALEAGDVVDVIATLEVLDAEGAPSVVVAASVAVVDAGGEVVTVAVPVAQVPAVAYAVTAGLVTLVLVPG